MLNRLTICGLRRGHDDDGDTVTFLRKYSEEGVYIASKVQTCFNVV